MGSSTRIVPKNQLKINPHCTAKEKREQPPAWAGWGRQKMVGRSHVGQREPAGTGENAGVAGLLTDTEAGYQLGSLVRHRAGGEDGLQQVGGEDQSYDVLRGGSDDEQLYPELEEGGQGAVHLQHVGIVPAGLGDGGAQLGVAQSAHDGEGPADGPHHQRQPRRAGLPQHPGGGDEDAGADDGPHDDGHAVDQRDGALQGHPLTVGGSGGGRRRAGAAVLLSASSRLQHLLHRLLLLLLRHGGGRARRAPLFHRAAAAAAARHRGGARSGAGAAGRSAATMQPPLLFRRRWAACGERLPVRRGDARGGAGLLAGGGRGGRRKKENRLRLRTVPPRESAELRALPPKVGDGEKRAGEAVPPFSRWLLEDRKAAGQAGSRVTRLRLGSYTAEHGGGGGGTNSAEPTSPKSRSLI